MSDTVYNLHVAQEGKRAGQWVKCEAVNEPCPLQGDNNFHITPTVFRAAHLWLESTGEAKRIGEVSKQDILDFIRSDEAFDWIERFEEYEADRKAKALEERIRKAQVHAATVSSGFRFQEPPVPQIPEKDQRPFLVYGTLRPGQGNYRSYLAGNTTAEETVRLPGYDMYSNGGFPYLVDGNGTAVTTLMKVKPEAYSRVLHNLDRLEGYRPGNRHNHYDRRLVTINQGGESIEAWLYVAIDGMAEEARTQLEHVAGGDWLNFDRDWRWRNRRNGANHR